MILLSNWLDPLVPIVNKSVDLGIPLVFQQTPYSIIASPPSDIIIPPLIADDIVTSVTAFVDITGIASDSPLLHAVQIAYTIIIRKNEFSFLILRTNLIADLNYF